MKFALIAAAAGILALAGTSAALAQPVPPPPGMNAPDAGPAPDAPPPPPPPGAPGPRADQPAPPPPPPPSPAAHFRIERGADVVDVKCEDGQPARACAEMVRQFVDRMPADTRR